MFFLIYRNHFVLYIFGYFRSVFVKTKHAGHRTISTSDIVFDRYSVMATYLT